MTTEEAKTEWEIEITKYKEKPIVLKKENIKEWLTNIIDTGITGYWCSFIGIEKKAENQNTNNNDSPYAFGYEPEAENIANGGTLYLKVYEPFETDKEEKDIETYHLTLDMIVEGARKFIDSCHEKWKGRLLTYNDKKQRYEFDMYNVDSLVDDTILQYALFGKIIYG